MVCAFFDMTAAYTTEKNYAIIACNDQRCFAKGMYWPDGFHQGLPATPQDSKVKNLMKRLHLI